MKQWIPRDTCVKCKKVLPVYELLYDTPEDNPQPMCYPCIIKDAQEKYGVQNVWLGCEN